MASLMYVDFPEYAAILFRRTHTDLALEGALMDRAADWLTHTPARWNERDKRWEFPSGATLTFGYLDGPNDWRRYDSAEFQCVALGTPILMGDGTWQAIENIRVGDEVATLEGPKRVSATHRPGVKPVTRVSTPHGSALVSSSHRLLSANGWASPTELRSIQSHVRGSTGEVLPDSLLDGLPQPVLQAAGSPRTHERASQTPLDKSRPAASSSGVDGQSGFVEFDDERLTTPQPLPCSVPLVLHGPAFRRAVLSPGRNDELHGEFCGCEGEDYPGGYRPGARSRDGRSLRAPTVCPTCTPSPSDVEARHPKNSHEGDPASALAHTQAYRGRLVHPYTSEEMDVKEDARIVWAGMFPAGEAEVADLSVEGANHYVSYPGIISQNCIGMDEATQFRPHDINAMMGRLRRKVGSPVPLRLRLGSNPGGEAHDFLGERFVAPAEPSVNRAFIPALFEDNPHLDLEEYGRTLESLAEADETLYRQRRFGEWIKDEGEAIFKRWWWDNNRYDPDDHALRNKAVARWASLDTANTVKETSAYSALVVGELQPDYTMPLRHVARERLEFPELVEWTISEVKPLTRDKKLRGLLIEDAASGTQLIQTLRASGPAWIRNLIVPVKPRGKEETWRAASIWAKRGMMPLPEPSQSVPWLHPYERELFSVPESTYKDQADATSMLIVYVEEQYGAFSTRWQVMKSEKSEAA